MLTVEKEDTVQLTFIGTIATGTLFINVPPDKAMSVKIGNNELPPTVEDALIGMRQKETKTVRVNADEGFGPRMKDLLIEVPTKVFGEHIDPKPGMILSQKVNKDGIEHQVPATVMEVREHTVLIDYNHPLAGHDLTYEITVLSIEKPAH